MRVLFVCLGNICRSPTAEGVLRHKLREAGLADQVEVASAGTGDWHVGNPTDKRSQAAAKLRGYDLSTQRAQQVSRADFASYDLILAMDSSNLRNLNIAAGTPGNLHGVALQDIECAATDGAQTTDSHFNRFQTKTPIWIAC